MAHQAGLERMLRAAGVAGVLAFGIALGMSGETSAQGWPGYAHDPQHTCVSGIRSLTPQSVRWSAPVDLNPQYSGNGDLFIHYGSPVITNRNLVLFPVKTGASGGFRVEARNGSDGSLFWTLNTDYVLPPHNWVPICGVSLGPRDIEAAIPGAGGTVLLRRRLDVARGRSIRRVFYGSSNYTQDKTAFNNAIKICTPLSFDQRGNLYFGYISTGVALPGYPNGIPSGLARLSKSGEGTFVSAADMAGDTAMKKVVYNCAPAFSIDNSTVYVAVNAGTPGNYFTEGYLCALDSATLARKRSVSLRDPRNSANKVPVPDDGSSTPTIGPDGDVYFGVLEAGFPSNHARGWLLHFNEDLSLAKLPSAFGWDDTASVVSAKAVPSYTGSSSYLLLTKYNNYGGFAGGDGLNKLALVDPQNSMTDPVTGATVMKTVLTVLGPTADQDLGGVREWCINSAAIDVGNKCAVVNSEDGHVYRWSFVNNTLSQGLMLAPPTGEAYTPTVIGPDGAVYAINNATLFSCASP